MSNVKKIVAADVVQKVLAVQSAVAALASTYLPESTSAVLAPASTANISIEPPASVLQNSETNLQPADSTVFRDLLVAATGGDGAAAESLDCVP